jgi:hypothetical protein
MAKHYEKSLWCPNCGGRDYTRDPEGTVGLSLMDVICDACGERYVLAVNLGAWIARSEFLERERESGVQKTAKPPEA